MRNKFLSPLVMVSCLLPLVGTAVSCENSNLRTFAVSFECQDDEGQTIKNVTCDVTSVVKGNNLVAKISATNNYGIIGIDKVVVGETTLTADDYYTYFNNEQEMIVIISSAKITNKIDITAKATNKINFVESKFLSKPKIKYSTMLFHGTTLMTATVDFGYFRVVNQQINELVEHIVSDVSYGKDHMTMQSSILLVDEKTNTYKLQGLIDFGSDYAYLTAGEYPLDIGISITDDFDKEEKIYEKDEFTTISFEPHLQIPDGAIAYYDQNISGKFSLNLMGGFYNPPENFSYDKGEWSATTSTQGWTLASSSPIGDKVFNYKFMLYDPDSSSYHMQTLTVSLSYPNNKGGSTPFLSHKSFQIYRYFDDSYFNPASIDVKPDEQPNIYEVTIKLNNVPEPEPGDEFFVSYLNFSVDNIKKIGDITMGSDSIHLFLEIPENITNFDLDFGISYKNGDYIADYDIGGQKNIHIYITL